MNTNDHAIIYDRNGKRVTRGNIVEDGDTVRFPIRLMDHGNPALTAAIGAAETARRIEQFDAKTAFPGMQLSHKQAALLDAAKLTPKQLALFKDHVTRKGFSQALGLAKRSVVSIKRTASTIDFALADPELQAEVDGLPPDRRKVFVDAFHHGNGERQLTFDEAMAIAKGVVPRAVGHRPGFGVMDATAVTASAQRCAERDARIADAWRNPPPIIDQQLPQSHDTRQSLDTAPGTFTHDELLARRDRRLEERFLRP